MPGQRLEPFSLDLRLAANEVTIGHTTRRLRANHVERNGYGRSCGTEAPLPRIGDRNAWSFLTLVGVKEGTVRHTTPRVLTQEAPIRLASYGRPYKHLLSQNV